ncbi:phage tail protein [Ferrimonas senticii]|uniref:phage tail protein n=1 Tax=Ferrimonas senticii TaxID=394566 RepID=UPI0003FFFE99|nr:phage tail protein [Ferrimonas senticii]
MNHELHSPSLPIAKAPWWMDGETLPKDPKEPAFLVRGLRQFWQQVKHWLLWPLTQANPLTCNERLLNLIGWERAVPRLTDEPLSLYRMRVHYAWQNFRDSGSAIGFKQIFERLGLGVVTIKERQPNTDWDVITIELNDSVISENQPLIANIIQLYGRTCRRYRFEVFYPATMQLRAAQMHYQQQIYLAELPA